MESINAKVANELVAKVIDKRLMDAIIGSKIVDVLYEDGNIILVTDAPHVHIGNTVYDASKIIIHRKVVEGR